ncbi:hypothetical protein HDR70_00390 [bacterium]|nr:hypothetical protein [bacterium]
MKWNKQLKEELGYLSAFTAFLFGMVMCLIGFLESPRGEVHQSVLWIFGQCLLYSASIIGASMYINSELKGMRKELGLKENEEKE